MSADWLGLLGLFTGLHAASWGAFKDSPFEGFRWRSYLRSVAIGSVAGFALGQTGGATGSEPVVVIGLLYTLERLVTEWWKTFLRDDDQTAYTIPMRLGYQGRPVESRAIRYLIGTTVAIGLITVTWATAAAQPMLSATLWWVPILVGGFGGWLTACGGAWKDAPIEGFSGRKFLRSPLVATAWAIPLSMMTHSLVLLTMSAGGLAVASIETYKTFLTGGRAPGKFATKPIRFQYPAGRRWLAAIHAGLWAVLSILLMTRVGAPLSLVRWSAVTPSASLVALAVVAAVSFGASALVLGSMIRLPT